VDEPLDPDDDSADRAELCDYCGAVLPEGDDQAVLALVRDSSAVYPDHPERDGQRMVQACGREHARALQAQYRRRPWRRREQWAGKAIAAIEARGGRAHVRDIAADTGLRRWQIRVGGWYSVWRLLRREIRRRWYLIRSGVTPPSPS